MPRGVKGGLFMRTNGDRLCVEISLFPQAVLMAPVASGYGWVKV